MDTLTLLDSYSSNTLWEMARTARLSGTTGKKPNKANLIRLMQREFFQPERIKATYQQLSETERAVLNRLQLRGGQTTTRLFGRELIRAGLATQAPPPPEPKKTTKWSRYRGSSIYGRKVTYIGHPNKPQSTIFEDVIARLTLYGLLFSEGTASTTGGTSYKLKFHPGEKLFIPPFVRQHLPPPEPLPADTNEWQPAHTLLGDPQLFLRDLYLYWDRVRYSPVAMIQSGFVGKRGLKQLNAALLIPDPALDKARQEDETSRLYLLRQVLHELRLIQSQGGELRLMTGSNRTIPDFWQKPTEEQVKAVITIWRTLSQPMRLLDQPDHYAIQPNIRQACQLLLTVLAAMPAAAWIEADDLLVGLQDRDDKFLIPMRSRIESGRGYGYYYGDTSEAIVKMDRLEQSFITQALAGFLFETGLVELGFDASSANPAEWHAFRLTPLGTAVLQNKSFDSIPATGQIIVQPNFQILAMGPVSLSLLAQLDLFAERQKVDRSAFEYHLSRESVYAAQQIGFTVAEVQRFLETVAPNDLPQNIRRSLAEWAAHHERIVFRCGVTLLQAADDNLLEQLLSQGETARLLARPVGNLVALVKSNRQPQLVKALQGMDIFPAVSGASPEAADKSVMVDENGRIHPIHAVPSLHLRGRLARFAEETAEADGYGWQLTEQSVRRGGGSKKKVQNMVDDLRKLNRGRLPKSIVEQMKAWGGYYGQAAVATMTLFEFRDQETLAELRQLPELADLLQPFPAGNRALAVVDGEAVTAVQTTLARLGVKITLL